MGFCLCRSVNNFVVCVRSTVGGNRPRTSVSQRSSQLEEKSKGLAVPADVIGVNANVCDWDKRYHKVTLSPCV